MVDATTRHELLSFMDAFSGFNKILMHPKDQDKTTFISKKETYCYKMMPFVLKNARVTYQRPVKKMFADLLERTIEVYIDDTLVKSSEANDHVKHLKECFEVFQKHNMKLNSTKCSFG